MTKYLGTMHSNNTYKSNNASNSNINRSSSSSMNSAVTNNGDTTITRMHPSMKRPRAPIACYRCHHKKVRCDGVHPNCTRCLSTGVLCAYPSSRRSRNTQPTNVDPFIDNLSQLEARIRRIETDLEAQRALVRTVCATTSGSSNSLVIESNNNALTSRMLKTEKDLQESRSIVAQLRLRGEQRAARGRRAASAASAAATATSVMPGSDKNASSLSGTSNMKDAGQHTASSAKRSNNNKLRVNSHTKKDNTLLKSPYKVSSSTSAATTPIDYNVTSPSPPFYFTQSDSSSPVDFMNPSSTNYYFPTSYNHHGSSITDNMTPICNSSTSGAPFMMVGDWPQLLNDLPTTAASNGFVDPMIIAAAEQGDIAPPLLSVSFNLVDEETSIMAARARSLPHSSSPNMMTIPGLQPSTSSTSTCSNTSTSFSNYMYDTGSSTAANTFAQFMESNINNCSSSNDATMIMIDQQMR